MDIILFLKWMIMIQGDQSIYSPHPIAIAGFAPLQKSQVWQTSQW